MNRNEWTSPERLYLDAAGKVVKADDPTRVSLLVGAGGSLPMERAQALGLTTTESKDVGGAESKDVPGPTESKDIKGPTGRKAK